MSWFACCHATHADNKEIEVTLRETSGPSVVTWVVELDKANWGRLGLELAPLDNVLRVEHVYEDGSVAEFNTSSPKEAILAGDHVIEVSGIKGVAIKMLAEVRKEVRQGRLNMTLSRSRTFRATISKADTLGASFGVFNRVLVVQDVSEGPIQEWNLNNPDQLIQPGDQILEVNGSKDEAGAILDRLKAGGNLTITVLPLGGAGSAKVE